MGQCHALDDKNKIMSIDYEICVREFWLVLLYIWWILIIISTKYLEASAGVSLLSPLQNRQKLGRTLRKIFWKFELNRCSRLGEWNIYERQQNINLFVTDGQTEGPSNLGTLELVPEHFK